MRDQVRDIFSNPAKFDENGYLRIRPYHSHTCEKCTSGNMCKKIILRTYLDEHPQYKRLYYAGDGGNDFCPLGLLKEGDIAFARRKFSLEKKIHQMETSENPGYIKS